ncbi:LuxR C-terminal-related transcriptional regulator [Nocardia sp. XZ_19_369]|uniref:helix-turn-helix transcriptional regulator n=1 Tax=Nocardia sp. XZ_19_369 TaxID=2769487 RepID=UPI00188E74DD|nr:LuxR C-terminal-related transcriptional regulator [Nocardia sp. XZ_19_369]
MGHSEHVDITAQLSAGRDPRTAAAVSGRVRVAVHATDPITRMGVLASLRGRAEVQVVSGDETARAAVRVVAADRVTAETLALLRDSAEQADCPVVLVVADVDPAYLLMVAECRVVAILPRAAATPDRVIAAVAAAAAGAGLIAPDLLGELLRQLERLHREVLTPNALTAASLTAREIEVIRLLADGFTAAEIARRINYSERTVKTVIYGVTRRMNLRSRAQLVAHAVRHGVI